jgi:membrane-associated phospholipid phosphatase
LRVKYFQIAKAASTGWKTYFFRPATVLKSQRLHFQTYHAPETTEISSRWKPYARAAGWIVLAVAVIALATLLDPTIANLCELPKPSPWRRLTWWASKLGEGWVVAVGGLAGSMILLLFGRVMAARLWFIAASTGLLTGAAASILRVFVGRTRPHVTEPQGFYGIWHDAHWIVGRYDYSSFPSGHAATAMGLAVAIWLIHRKAGALVWLFAAMVAWSRVAVGSHHFSDTVGSCFLALFAAPFIFKFLGIAIDKATSIFQTLRK